MLLKINISLFTLKYCDNFFKVNDLTISPVPIIEVLLLVIIFPLKIIDTLLSS